MCKLHVWAALCERKKFAVVCWCGIQAWTGRRASPAQAGHKRSCVPGAARATGQQGLIGGRTRTWRGFSNASSSPSTAPSSSLACPPSLSPAARPSSPSCCCKSASSEACGPQSLLSAAGPGPEGGSAAGPEALPAAPDRERPRAVGGTCSPCLRSRPPRRRRSAEASEPCRSSTAEPTARAAAVRRVAFANFT
jgi:hypothetical protein